VHAVPSGASDVMGDPFDEGPVRVMRRMHVDTTLFNGIGEVWSSQGEVL
jgi:hypothetical protein